MPTKKRLALIGAGRMGGALLARWLEGAFAPSEILVVDPRPGERARALAEAKKIPIHDALPEDSPVEAALFAVKPQALDAAATAAARRLNADALVVSIAAGRTLASLETIFGERPMIRAMPNTPVAIGKGATVFVASAGAEEAHKALARALFEPGGFVAEADTEAQLDAVTAVSGSGPAYVFLLAEALAGAARAEDLPEVLAARLARETVIGAAALMEADAEKSPGQMRDEVTSPGGATAAALDVLYDKADTLPRLVRAAVGAAARRAKELGR